MSAGAPPAASVHEPIGRTSIFEDLTSQELGIHLQRKPILEGFAERLEGVFTTMCVPVLLTKSPTGSKS